MTASPNVHKVSDIDQAREFVRNARADGNSWLPVGERTRQSRLHPELKADQWLSSTNLRSVHWLDAEDRTCEVDAGLPVAELTDALAQHGLMLGHHAQHGGTVGGLLNSGDPSLLAGSCGLPRDQVLGATWLLADGRVIRSGARVVKSVAGYDVTRLFLSAHGQLAMCLRLILRLRPIPQDLRWYRLPLDLHRPPASWKPWCDFSIGEHRWAAWDGCSSPLQDAVAIAADEGGEAWRKAQQESAKAQQWIATPTPWLPQQMAADGKNLDACLIADHLAMQSAWSSKQTLASMPEGSAVLPHSDGSEWLQPMREALQLEGC